VSQALIWGFHIMLISRRSSCFYSLLVLFSERSVHDDVQICQWLRKGDNKLKLGDFNRAEIMEYDSEEREYCKYKNGRGWGNYRSPEEFSDHDLNEKIDVFTFGNNIYGLVRMF
jgi:hypothetical protein